jgi:hypothetical protein
MRLDLALGIALLATKTSCGQLPKSGTLSAQDERSFRAELSRLEWLSETAADKATVDYTLARTWAAGQQWPEAMQWLRRVDPKSGIDPSKDRIFASLRGTAEFEEVIKLTREAATPIGNSRQAFRIAEGDLAPESMAYDPGAKMFYFGSLKKGKVVRCSPVGACTDFVTGMGTILGLKADGKYLRFLNNSDQESALMTYELKTARMVRKHAVGAGHLLNDLVISPTGEVFMTDTRGGAVWRLAPGAQELEILPGQFQFANGIAFSSDAERLYVSTFPDGVTVFDLRTHAASALRRPSGLCLANVDGLYFYRGNLIAIQTVSWPHALSDLFWSAMGTLPRASTSWNAATHYLTA